MSREDTTNIKTTVNQWIAIDTEISQLYERIKHLRATKIECENNIIEYANDNNIKNLSIKTHDGMLKISKTKQMQPLTFKYLSTCLSSVLNSNDSSNILNYIKEQRKSNIIIGLKKV